MILFHKRDLIIWLKCNQILWPFSWVMHMPRPQMCKFSQFCCCSPCHWRNGDKSLFVTTMELSTKTPSDWPSEAVHLNKELFWGWEKLPVDLGCSFPCFLWDCWMTRLQKNTKQNSRNKSNWKNFLVVSEESHVHSQISLDLPFLKW